MKHRTLQDLSDKELLRMKVSLERKKILRKLAREIIAQRKSKNDSEQGPRRTIKAQVVSLAQFRAQRLKA